MLVPLYGFLRGDTLGLIVLVQDDDPVEEIARSLVEAAAPRVAPSGRASVCFRGVRLEPTRRIGDTGLGPLDRVDVVWTEE